MGIDAGVTGMQERQTNRLLSMSASGGKADSDQPLLTNLDFMSTRPSLIAINCTAQGHYWLIDRDERNLDHIPTNQGAIVALNLT